MKNLQKTINEILRTEMTDKDRLTELTQAVTTWALEMVGSDTNKSKTNPLGYPNEHAQNFLRAEIRYRIRQSMGERV